MQVAIYSGSFDPLHIGHLAILETLSREFDQVRLVVSPQNPLKDSSKSVNADSRLDAARAALGRHPELDNVEVDPVEYSLPVPNYTITTLDFLRDINPDDSFTLAIGADNLGSIRRWRDYSRILKEYGVAVYPRTGYEMGTIKAELLEEDPAYRITLLDCPLVDISSTEIRRRLAAGESVSDLLM